MYVAYAKLSVLLICYSIYCKEGVQYCDCCCCDSDCCCYCAQCQSCYKCVCCKKLSNDK